MAFIYDSRQKGKDKRNASIENWGQKRYLSNEFLFLDVVDPMSQPVKLLTN